MTLAGRRSRSGRNATASTSTSSSRTSTTTLRTIYTANVGVQQCVFLPIDNPYFEKVGISRTMQIDASASTAATAASSGLMALQLAINQARVTGSATISGLVSQGQIPPWMLKAGVDRLPNPNLPGQNAVGTTNDFAVSRVEASITADGFSTTLGLGAGANRIDVLTARMQAASMLAAIR